MQCVWEEGKKKQKNISSVNYSCYNSCLFGKSRKCCNKKTIQVEKQMLEQPGGGWRGGTHTHLCRSHSCREINTTNTSVNRRITTSCATMAAAFQTGETLSHRFSEWWEIRPFSVNRHSTPSQAEPETRPSTVSLCPFNNLRPSRIPKLSYSATHRLH